MLTLLRYKIPLKSLVIFVILAFISSCSEKSGLPEPVIRPHDDDREMAVIVLNLRIHIMRDIVIPHPSGISLDSWLTPEDVSETVIPEINAIWDQAKIEWDIESVIEEDVVKDAYYEQSINFIANCVRDEAGHADPERLPLLYSMMQPQYRSKADELDRNLFHLYIFPFVGNTSQGNAMKDFNWHCVVGSWSNKHNGGGTPEKTFLVEYHNEFVRGSLARTASHELGHVLNLQHNQCTYNCLMGGDSDGYLLTKAQVTEARYQAMKRNW